MFLHYNTPLGVDGQSALNDIIGVIATCKTVWMTDLSIPFRAHDTHITHHHTQRNRPVFFLLSIRFWRCIKKKAKKNPKNTAKQRLPRGYTEWSVFAQSSWSSLAIVHAVHSISLCVSVCLCMRVWVNVCCTFGRPTPCRARSYTVQTHTTV